MPRRPNLQTSLTWLQIVGAALLAPLALFPTPARFAALLVFPGLWFCRWLVTRRLQSTPGAAPARFIQRTPLDGAIALLLLMVLVSLFATYDIAASLPKIAGLILGLAVYYAVAEALADGRWLRWGLRLYLGLGAGLAALALVGTNWVDKSPVLAAVTARLPSLLRGLPGAEAGFHPNEVAGALLWFVPLALSGWVAALWPKKYAASSSSWGAWGLRFLAGLLGLLLMAGVLVLTQSRSAAVGLAVGLWVMLAALDRWGRGLALAAVGLAGGALAYLGQGALGDFLFGGYALEPIGALNLADRLEIWSRALYAIRDFPFTGLGLNAFRTVAPVMYPLFLRDPSKDLGHAHNQALQVALDLGLPGLVAYLALVLLAGWLLVCAWRQAREGWLRAAALGLGGSLVAFSVYGLTDAIGLGSKPDMVFWFMLALSVSVWRASGKTTGSPPIL